MISIFGMMSCWRTMETLFSFILLFQIMTSQIGTSVPTTTRSLIEFLQPPMIVSKNPIVEVLYQCQRDQVVHVDVLASSVMRPLVGIFKKRWTCTANGEEMIQEIRLNFPDQVVYREDPILRRSIYVTDIFLRAWISDHPIDFNLPDRFSFNRAVAKTTHHIVSLPPYSRPYKDHQRSFPWDQDLLWKIRMAKIPQCQAEQEVFPLLSFLYACTGEGFGLVKKLAPYKDRALESQRQRHSILPRCSFSTWLYLTDPCTISFCGVLYRLDVHNDYVTPTLLMTPSGHLHVQVQLINKEAHAFRSVTAVPLHQWCHVLLTLDITQANLTIACGLKSNSTTYKFPDNVLLSDISGTFHLGGSRFVFGMSGFYGPSVYYRNKIVTIYKTPPPRIIQRVELPQWFLKCEAFKEECSMRFQHFLSEAKSKRTAVSCRDPYSDLIAHHQPSPSIPQCTDWEEPPVQQRALITRLLRRRAGQAGHTYLDSELLGQALHRIYLKRVLAPEGLSRIRKFMPILLQAGCLGHDPALFLASVLFQTGLGMKRDQNKALKFGLLSAQKDDRLSHLSLGHKHHLGVDGYPLDYDLSYGYYSNIARQTMADRTEPGKNQAFVEYVRLIDDEVLKQQTKENDDLFMWLKFQAKQGVSSAQQAVSRMLFWGQQGISSNLEAAVRFYEKGALQQKDPVLMYDYGIVLLRGQGVKQDIPKALQYLKKAADMDFVPALNSLGWYYEQYEKDYKKAAEYWERADELGNPEAPFNLGILYFHGLYPGKPQDHSSAYRHYLRSAMRGHIDAAVHVSAYWIQGLPGVVDRVPQDAVLWTKWVGEQNGYLGALLRKALDNYLEHSWPAALLYYLQAAETGIEVAQFNTAFFCELDAEGVVSRYLQIDCEWKYYNLSAYSERPPAYAQIKMGDLFYNHHIRRKRDVQAAVRMYTAAALQREPQGLYNLGILVEEGVTLSHSTLRQLGFNGSATANNYTIIMELYRRCRDHEKEDSYVPCSLALLNAHLQYVWTFHASLLKCSSAAAIAIVTALSLMTIFGRLQNAARQLHLSV
ncbi:protein sel-1 homolog 3-like isoform X2 [Hyperolius riggenbachi]|uniref:protein sel-1 homolog 3-like isoform X2 n=1 Tax=Hyperolius riggenbachi TaxID=752182 RepID=UPI0035A2A8A9